MADAIIGPLVGRLQALALSEAQAVVAVSDDIRRLRDKLMWLQAFLREADAKRHGFSNEFTKVWLQQTRDAVFDAEDAVDHYYLKVQVDMSRYPGWARSCMRYIATFTTQIAMRHSLSRKVKKINSSLEDIIKNKDMYKMDDENKKPEVSWKASTSISYTLKDDFQQPQVTVHEEQRKKLEEALSPTEQKEVQNKDENHHPVVISVIGKSGAGKTTLVRDIYEKMVARDKTFSVHVMESFAPYLTATTIIQQIVQRLTPDNTNCPKNKVREMLENKLKEKKYLLVIDGEVSSTEWNNILDKLPPSAVGSRVVHITQHKPEEPPSKYRHVPIHLHPLQPDNTIDLFRERLLHTEPQDKESLGKSLDGFLEQKKDIIYKITEGLPLAVVLLSGLVQTKEFSEEWNQVFDYLNSKKSKRLDSLLSVCFDDLPHELKCCFLYFAALPANITIEAHTLVCMWMAEGFLRPIVGKRIEKVGYIYLNELIARNLVNPVHMDADDFSAASKSVTIQNKVHEFLQFEAQEASFVEVQIGDDIPTLTSARRLSLQNYKDKYAALANPLPKLRSIFSHFEQEDQIYQGTAAISKKIKNMKSHIRGLLRGSEFLRVIKLQGIEIGAKLPDEIGNVVHLQYLGITSCLLEEIPQSIGRLTSLQTLDVRETHVRDLPLTFWRIKTLRHVFGFALKLPNRIGGLKHIKTLNSIRLDNDDQHGLVGKLEEMINLRYLYVWNVSERNAVDLSGALKKLEDLRTLILQGEVIPSSVLTNSSSRRIKYMVLQGELNLPSELSGMVLCLPNLVMLSLERTNVSQEFITKLAELPCLATLALNSDSYKGERLVFYSDGFRNLKKLKIDEDLSKRVELEEGAIPLVKNVDVFNRYTGHHHKVEITIDEEHGASA